MKALQAIHIVQFSFWEYETFELSPGGTAFIGPNGAGKTSLVDAVQIAMVGGHGQHMHFNAQSVQKDARSLCDYALGAMRSGEGDKGVLTRKRDTALSYITLVFAGERAQDCVSAGMCIYSQAVDKSHKVLGHYVLPGVELSLEDHLEDLGKDGKAPLEWTTFEAECRNKARAVGLTPTFTPKPEAYVSELLHNIQQSDQPISPRRFLRALGHSINLKQVSSVGDFLRGYLVEATPIDKQGTLRHIKTLKKLNQQIDEVNAQLVTLADLDKRFRGVHNLHRARLAAAAAKLRLQVEAADGRVGALTGQVDDLSEKAGAATGALRTLKEVEQGKEEAYQRLLQQQANDDERKSVESAGTLRRSYADAVKLARRAPETAALQVRSALLAISEAIASVAQEESQALRLLHDKWESTAKAGNLPSLLDAQDALRSLQAVKPVLSQVAKAEAAAASQAAKHLTSVQGKQLAARGGTRMNDLDVGAAMALFAKAKISCQTVASLVRVTDLAWQGAIEAFLGRNRFAIVVEPDREREAVRLMRRAQIPEVTVVQPAHLRDALHIVPGPRSVAALLKSDNPIALAFLRRILGKMLQVETEEELEANPRALTRDYMLSANGGTKRIRELPQSEWVLGVQISNDDREKLRQELTDAVSKSRDAAQAAERAKSAEAELTSVLATFTVESYQLVLGEFEGAKNQLDAEAAPPQSVSERLAKLEESVRLARVAWEQARQAATDKQIELNDLNSKRATQQEHLRRAKEALDDLEVQLDELTSDRDYDPEIAAASYEKVLELANAGKLAEALASLDRDRQTAENKLPSALQSVTGDFALFINDHSINLVEERSDWRKAWLWVGRHAKLLNDSTLTQYKKDAEEAKVAAEQAFRSDVKYRLREAIQKVDHEIRDLNRILDGCPTFTGGERYRFVADVSPAHRELYELIVRQPDDGGSETLFESNAVQGKLLSLMEASEKGEDKGNNPLEDYRLFYNFDLEIRVDGVKVDLLSKRMGVASNGEHRVPFYVIAGAALATAYRLKPGSTSAAGVMILDEAFYGMDAQNTFVTAEFLRSLGLQLVMAGPDSDVGKLLPVLDVCFDLTRFGPDVFIDRVVVKEPARKLMQSDLPERNPQLVEDKVRQLTLAAK